MYPWYEHPARTPEEEAWERHRQRQQPRSIWANAPKKTLKLEAGTLVIHVLDGKTLEPIENATVRVNGEGAAGTKVYYTVQTNGCGFTRGMTLPTLAKQYSLRPGRIAPYYTYAVTVSRQGYKTQVYRGIQIFADTESRRDAMMARVPGGRPAGPEVVYTEPPHGLVK